MKNNSFNKNQKRVFFKNSEMRESFFSLLKKKFGTWAAIHRSFKIYRSRLENFRNGKILMPQRLFLSFLSHIDKKQADLFLNQIILKDANWGRIKGGKVTYALHKEIFEVGRRIAIKNGKKTVYHFDFNTPLTKELCELLGAYIGDGFTNKYGRTYIVQFTGHAALDKEYLTNNLKHTIKNLCPNSNPIIWMKNNTIRLTINSKEFNKLLTERFGFPLGVKTYTVQIPDEILHSNQPFINSCIRGIFDTDGCVFFDTRERYKKPYLRIALNMKSKPVMNQISELLSKQGIESSKTRYSKRIQINGFHNCKKFINIIGFSNQRHLNKIKRIIW